MMAVTIMTGSFAAVLIILAVLSERARQRGKLPLWLTYLILWLRSWLG